VQEKTQICNFPTGKTIRKPENLFLLDKKQLRDLKTKLQQIEYVKMGKDPLKTHVFGKVFRYPNYYPENRIKILHSPCLLIPVHWHVV